MKVNLATGLAVSQVHTPEQKAATRVKQMRVAIWCGVEALKSEVDKGGSRLVMFTLTYRGVFDWAPRSIRRFGRWLSKEGSKGYIWVAELQKRGAVHYHVLALWETGRPWIKPERSNGAWVKGFTWVTDNVKYPWYIMKYIQKGTKDGRSIRYPKGLRIYCVSRGTVSLMRDTVRDTYRAIHLPEWYRQGAVVAGKLRDANRVSGGVAFGQFIYLTPYAARYPVLTQATVRDMWYAWITSGDFSPQYTSQ
jgi:hypothetical protein